MDTATGASLISGHDAVSSRRRGPDGDSHHPARHGEGAGRGRGMGMGREEKGGGNENREEAWREGTGERRE